MNQLTICQSPFGLKWSLSGKCSGRIFPLKMIDWGRLLCCHGDGEWSQRSFCRFLMVLWVLTSPVGFCTFPVLLTLAQLASAAGNLSSLSAWWWPSWCWVAFWGLTVIPTCLLAWAAVGHGVTLLQYDNLSGKLTVQQGSYFPVSSLDHPGISETFHTRMETPED